MIKLYHLLMIIILLGLIGGLADLLFIKFDFYYIIASLSEAIFVCIGIVIGYYFKDMEEKQDD
jgi:hypothetical protein